MHDYAGKCKWGWLPRTANLIDNFVALLWLFKRSGEVNGNDASHGRGRGGGKEPTRLVAGLKFLNWKEMRKFYGIIKGKNGACKRKQTILRMWIEAGRGWALLSVEDARCGDRTNSCFWWKLVVRLESAVKWPEEFFKVIDDQWWFDIACLCVATWGFFGDLPSKCSLGPTVFSFWDQVSRSHPGEDPGEITIIFIISSV